MRRLVRKTKPAILYAVVEGIGNTMVVTGQRDPHLVKAEIILGSAPKWLDAMQRGGRLTIRTSAIVATWIEGGNE